jgi:dCMP deaminase
MEVARAIAERGTCERGFVGAVIAKDGRIISTGYVGAPSGASHCLDEGCEIGTHNGCTRTVHAEANAIAFAARHGISTEASTIYTTLAPCYECAKLIINAGVERLVYEVNYRDIRGLTLLERTGLAVEHASN